MSPTSYGPIAELRHATRSPLGLTVGSLIGGAAPLTNFFTIHFGDLIRTEPVFRMELRSPLWILVAGSFLLSSKSVFRWAHNTFGDWLSAIGIVLMLEGNLILAPHPAMKICALVFLVLINAAHYGSALGLRDQQDKAKEAAEKAELAREAQAKPVQVPAAPVPAAAPVAAAKPVPVSTAPKPLPTPRPAQSELYSRAIEAVGNHSSTSTKALQLALRIRQPLAAELMDQLEKAGVVGEADPADRGRRPVLTRTKSA